MIHNNVVVTICGPVKREVTGDETIRKATILTVNLLLGSRSVKLSI